MDLFISYRRDTGSSQAALLNEKLRARGVKTFFDKHSIHSEDFLDTIKKNIDNSPNFLIVLTPGYFKQRTDVETDWVREEIRYATEKGKNFIAVRFENYDVHEVDFTKEEPAVAQFGTFNALPYNDYSKRAEKASIDDIIEGMVDKDGKKFSLVKKVQANSWYSSHEMTDEDLLWILTDHDVCKKLDWELFDKILAEDVFKDREEINLFTYKAYEIGTYAKKYGLNPKRKNGLKIDNVYGVTYSSFLEYADELFGEGHFVSDDFPSEDYGKQLAKILKEHNLPGFDIIDLTLVIKDTKNPEKRVWEMAQYLNPEGGVIYIRELDDDYIDAYPDEKEYIKRMVKYLDLDDGAGNRHTGKKIYTFLKKAGADKVFISDQVISTANHKPAYQKKICDTYFSYLKPEMQALAKEHPENEEYVEASHWINENYDEVERLFCSTEFYFRAGYIAGYGVFKADEDD